MRTRWITRLALTASLAIATTGCFALDEMDKSAKLDNSYSAPGAKVVAKTAGAAEPGAAKAKPGAAPAANAAAKPASPTGDAWWRTASSVTSEEGDSSITSCALGGRSEFMQRDDCLARGGTPQ
jgi:hypothetical protein